MTAGFLNRFEAILDIHSPDAAPLYLAMVVNPKYKLDYGPNRRSYFSNMAELLNEECKAMKNRKVPCHLKDAIIQNEVMRYLRTPSTIHIDDHLNMFPTIKDGYLKYHTVRIG